MDPQKKLKAINKELEETWIVSQSNPGQVLAMRYLLKEKARLEALLSKSKK